MNRIKMSIILSNNVVLHCENKEKNENNLFCSVVVHCKKIIEFFYATIPQVMAYDHQTASKKWSKMWQDHAVYEPNLSTAKKPYYNLMMFPYPSAEGLHVGNMYAFSGADIYGRYQRMLGHDVFEPIGLDGFGIHSENYAIKIGKHPAEQAKVSEKNFYRQLSTIGNGFAWNERLETYDPEYYKWTQWLFVQMFKHGLAYKASSQVNWCPSCKTVLADEQVEDGKCERCKSEVERKEAKQWFFKITDYADRLLTNIEGLKWPEKIRIAQRQWIGKKAGINIVYQVVGSTATIICFTTKPVNFGATFLVLAPEHELVRNIIDEIIKVPKKNLEQVKKYTQEALNKSDQQRKIEEKKKTGVFTGLYVLNHVTKKEIPVWISDFVLGTVGTGAVQGCPGHDERDFEFAKKFEIPIPRVVIGKDGFDGAITSLKQVVTDGGTMVNSEFLDGMEFHDAMEKTMDYFEEHGWGKRVISYHLRDWLISRQRFWGPPIPMVECKKCGWQAVPEDQLSVELPFIQDYKPTGDGKSPLEKAPKTWLYTACPTCGAKAKRETDVSDTFLDSSWYFLRYPSLFAASAATQPFDPAITKKWLPVTTYIGGAEHAVLHLLYSRFVTMALKDWGYLEFEEPFPFLFGHGLIIKDGSKMSKSKGNVVNPDEYIEKFGVDTLRTYLMFLGPYNQGGDFRDTGIAGMERWMQKVWRLFHEKLVTGSQKTSPKLQTKLHKTIKKCTTDMADFKYNTCIAAMMECTNLWLSEGEMMGKDDALKFLCLLAPFAPYMTEELYQTLFQPKTTPFSSIHTLHWPAYEESLTLDDMVEIAIQINGKFRGKMAVQSSDAKDKALLEHNAQKEEKIARILSTMSIKNIIVVPGKLVNIVCA
ncbi:MAG: leucine--tRNA ligase [Candidatus Pacebacteria bacterium]|nr:leucine--tRNA ligase [Candidatus Paceibacterota bacterium]